MYLESMGKSPSHFSRSCVRNAQKAFPVRFSYLSKLRRSVQDKFITGREKISDLDPISTAEFAGRTGDVSDIGGIDPPITLTDLGEDGVFSGLLFQFAPFQTIDLDWVWEGSDTPRVGVSAIPIPAAVWLFGSGLLGLIGIARKKRPA